MATVVVVAGRASLDWKKSTGKDIKLLTFYLDVDFFNVLTTTPCDLTPNETTVANSKWHLGFVCSVLKSMPRSQNKLTHLDLIPPRIGACIRILLLLHSK